MIGPVRRLATSVAVCVLASVAAPEALAQRQAPSREDTADYFASVRADLYTCARGWHGEVAVAVTFAGDGHVVSAAVDEAVPAEVASCVRSVLRGGTIQAFDGPTTVVEHTLRL